MRYLLLLLLFCTPACGREVNQQFVTYVNDFTSDTYICPESSIEFDDPKNTHLTPGGIAVCLLGAKQIYINKNDWGHLSDDEKREVIYHELMHCELDKEHVDDHSNFMYKNMASPTPDRETIKKQAKGLL
jgi:hypothetical protein